ncbi:MAG: hypothetical protein QXF97_06095 [Candidatus Caldarchaeum sp.]
MQVFERRFRERLEKARIYPDFVHSIAPHLRRLRYLKKALSLGYKPYLFGGELERAYLPYHGRLEIFGLNKTYRIQSELVGYDGRVFLNTGTSMHNKTIYLELGEALPPFFPTKPNEPITVSKQEFLKMFNECKRYMRRLSRYMDVSYPEIPDEDFEVVFTRRWNYDLIDLIWIPKDLFTTAHIYRTLTDKEKRRIEQRERLLMEYRRSIEEVRKLREIAPGFYEVDIQSLPSALVEKISDVAEKVYIIKGYYYYQAQLGMSANLSTLIACKILRDRGIDVRLHRRINSRFHEPPADAPKELIRTEDFYIKPKPVKELPKPPLAKPIITHKRVILLAP